MNKVTSDHLRRQAFVYVRQSTIDQVHNNRESQRRQYSLANRARAQSVIGMSEPLDDRRNGATA